MWLVFGIGMLQGRDALLGDSTTLHFSFELMHVADTRKEVRLATAIRIKGSKPTIPLPFGCLCLFEIANDRKFT